MALTSFVPEVWSRELLAAFDPLKRWSYGTNNDYELEIRQGGGAKAIINSVDNRTPGTYSLETGFSGKSKGATQSIDFELTELDDDVLLIDDVEMAQQKSSLRRPLIGRVVEGLAVSENKFIAQTMYDGGSVLAGATAANPKSVATPDDLLDMVYDMHTKLVATNADVNPGNTYLNLDPVSHSQLLRNDVFRDALRSGSTATLRKGSTGEFLGMTVVLTNVAPTPSTGTSHPVVISHSSATTYAERWFPLKAVDSTDFYGEEIQVVHQYGAMVTRPAVVQVGHWVAAA